MKIFSWIFIFVLLFLLLFSVEIKMNYNEFNERTKKNIDNSVVIKYKSGMLFIDNVKKDTCNKNEGFTNFNFDLKLN